MGNGFIPETWVALLPRMSSRNTVTGNVFARREIVPKFAEMPREYLFPLWRVPPALSNASGSRAKRGRRRQTCSKLPEMGSRGRANLAKLPEIQEAREPLARAVSPPTHHSARPRRNRHRTKFSKVPANLIGWFALAQ